MTTEKKPKPQVQFQVTESEKALMVQDALDVGSSVSAIMKTLYNKYWDSYVAKQKRFAKK